MTRPVRAPKKGADVHARTRLLTPEERSVLERCIKAPIFYTYAPCPVGDPHVKLIRFNADVILRPALDRLAMLGLVARSVTGCEGRREPPETTVTYTATALGRDEVGVHAPIQPLRNVTRLKTSARMLEEANARPEDKRVLESCA